MNITEHMLEFCDDPMLAPEGEFVLVQGDWGRKEGFSVGFAVMARQSDGQDTPGVWQEEGCAEWGLQMVEDVCIEFWATLPTLHRKGDG